MQCRDSLVSRTVAWALLTLVMPGCGGDTGEPSGAAESSNPVSAESREPALPKTPAKVTLDPVILASFQPLPDVMESASNPVTDEKIELGRMLYYDKRLSKSHEIACNSCHLLDRYGVDGEPTSEGHNGQRGSRNSPTVYNAAGHLAQFWDGRAADVEEQAKGPVLNPVEMAMPDESYVLQTLNSIPRYVEMFKAAFPGADDAVTYDNMAAAIGAFERKLLTPSPWDDLLLGDRKALSEAEKQGFNDFTEAGCLQCHTGTYVGGGSFQKLGKVRAWPTQKDLGRYEVTKKEADKMFFKVPGLRNVTETAPYFHDGSQIDLREVVRMMSRHQIGKELSDEKIDSIITWLKSLKGEIPAAYVAEPELPAGTNQTPKPDKS